jgi:hypothetical protein
MFRLLNGSYQKRDFGCVGVRNSCLSLMARHPATQSIRTTVFGSCSVGRHEQMSQKVPIDKSCRRRCHYAMLDQAIVNRSSEPAPLWKAIQAANGAKVISQAHKS